MGIQQLLAGGSVPPVPPPANTVAPSISGAIPVGSTLTVVNGTWTGAGPITYTYQWRSNGVDIGGATGTTYVTQAADSGTTITCQVTATNAGGSSSVASNGIVPIAAPVSTGAPVVTGGVSIGSLLNTTNGTWTGAPTITYAYQWLQNGVVISGQTGSSYTTVAGDAGKAVTCRVTATNPGGSTAAVSNGITVVAPPVNTAAPVISGLTAVGSTLTSTTGTWTGAVSYAYQWLQNGLTISGQTGTTYVTAPGDAGKVITCRVTATNTGGSTPAVSNGITVAGAGTNFTITAGNNGFGTYGWSASPSALGAYGSSSPAAPTIGGETICAASDFFAEFYFYLAGNKVGSTAWTQFTINGKTYTRAGAINPTGTLDGGSTYWKYGTIANLANGVQYPVVVT